MPALTIAMPVFNDVDFIEAALKSLLNQTFGDFVLIISDDGSTDGSQAICEKYAALDKRITYIRQPKNLGISNNMNFLLGKANTEFLMWAADDDEWAPNFIETLIANLKNHPEAVSSFGTFVVINEKGERTSGELNFDYRNENTVTRLKNFIANSNDSFGYGIFRTEKIKGAQFPVWWWPNKKTAYNNIYPALCYYLAKGNYVQATGEALFWNRFKSEKKINHKLPYAEDGLRETLAFAIRRFNLITFSTKLIRKAGGLELALKIYPTLFKKWFLVPAWYKLKHYFAVKAKR